MKIRPKLILAEIVINIVLFLAILTSVNALARFISFEDFKIKTIKLQEATSKIKYSVVATISSTEPTFSLVEEYEGLWKQVDERLVDIMENHLFNKLSSNTRNQFSNISVNLEKSRENLSPESLRDYLTLRDNPENIKKESLLYLQTFLDPSDNAPREYANQLDNAISKISEQETALENIEGLIRQTLAAMLQTTEVFSHRQILISTIIPAIAFIIAILAILIFTNSLSRKLIRLDKSLSNIVGGDFSVRIETKGRDEFSSLADSINTFTKTLGTKMESFRLIMHEIGQTLSTSMDSSQVESTLLKLAMRETNADGAALYKVGGERGELILSVASGKFRPPFVVPDLPDSPEEEDIVAILHSRIIPPGETVLGESALNGRPIRMKDIENNGELDWSRPDTDLLFISSLIVVPLQIGSTVFGVIAITSSKKGRSFSDLEFANIQSFGELAAITLDNIYKYADLLEATQLNRELGIAEEIQSDLLPKRLPRLTGGEVAILSRSIKGLNGDYYDVFPLGGGKTLVTICEVAGRGVPAGLVMVMIRTILRLVASPEHDAKTIMSMLNRDMTLQIAIESYASVGILILDIDGNFTFSSAAHYPLQLLRSNTRSFESFQTEGIPVGIDKNAEFEQQQGVLQKNDIIMFHTDGVPESRNREDKNFGVDKLFEIVSSEADNSPENIIDTIKVELEDFEKGVEQKDDQTVIILKYTGRSNA